jgi:hypothetical protein
MLKLPLFRHDLQDLSDFVSFITFQMKVMNRNPLSAEAHRFSSGAAGLALLPFIWKGRSQRIHPIL